MENAHGLEYTLSSPEVKTATSFKVFLKRSLASIKISLRFTLQHPSSGACTNLTPRRETTVPPSEDRPRTPRFPSSSQSRVCLDRSPQLPHGRPRPPSSPAPHRTSCGPRLAGSPAPRSPAGSRMPGARNLVAPPPIVRPAPFGRSGARAAGARRLATSVAAPQA